MPVAPSEFSVLDVVRDEDLAAIAQQSRDDLERIVATMEDWERQIQWGRVPQEQLTYLTDSPAGYNFYREWVGRSDYRIIYEISSDVMTVVAVLAKDDDTYDLGELSRRMDRSQI